MAFLQAIIDIIFPGECVCCGCSIPNGFHDICPSCREGIEPVNGACPRCAGHLEGGRCPTCSDREIYMSETRALALYRGMMKKAIVAMKFGRNPRPAMYFSEMAAELARSFSCQFDCITAVPMSRRKKWRRGFNQSEVLGKNIAKQMGVPYRTVLKEVRGSGLQKTLSLKERFINIIGRYRVIDRSIAGKSILLVDDVYTTGATINECSRLMREAGCGGVCALVLARVDRTELTF